jgi:hypothetical protein
VKKAGARPERVGDRGPHAVRIAVWTSCVVLFAFSTTFDLGAQTPEEVAFDLARGSLEAQPPPAPQPNVHVPALTAFDYRPITAAERVDWTIVGTVGLRSLGVGVLAASWQTGFNTPDEWGRTWRGFGKRYLEREADVAISNSIEAGGGALWGEEPRYIRSGRRGIKSRAAYAMKVVMLTQRRDGHLAPAWARYASNVFNNLIENQWLPPSATTARETTVRSLEGFLGRLGGNMWEEFWPDIRRRVFKPR